MRIQRKKEPRIGEKKSCHKISTLASNYKQRN